jgi:hypothetical protein
MVAVVMVAELQILVVVREGVTKVYLALVAVAAVPITEGCRGVVEEELELLSFVIKSDN